MTFDASCAQRTSPALDTVVRELDHLTDRLVAAAQVARVLAAGTDWHARAATAFHEAAEDWAGSVARLGGLAESARLAAVDARATAHALAVARCA